MQAFVPKVRRPRFEVTLRVRIHDLNNVPLVSGSCFIKWHISNSPSAEHRGHTSKAIIKEHKVSWKYEKTFAVRLTVDRSQMLQECELCFEVLQEYHSSGSRGERIVLGAIRLNLPEYVDAQGSHDDGEKMGITRRYLMQESKINSTVKISINMKLLEGDRNFESPSLKSAPVFGGIAGIMSAEQTDQDDIRHIPSISKPRDASDQADTYRRTLAASWTAQAGEMPADTCIENIFMGGTGWRNDAQPGSLATEEHGIGPGSNAEKDSSRYHRRDKSIGQDISHSTNHERRTVELDEFDLRDDLRSWSLR